MRTAIFYACIIPFLCAISSLMAVYTPPEYVGGHSVWVARVPEESTVWKIALIKNAKQSIELATGFIGGEMFAKIVLLLRDQLLREPNLQVHLGVASCLLLDSGSEEVLKRIQQQFPNRFHYQITSMALSLKGGHWQTCEQHVKLLVVDEKYFVTGGTNLYDSYCQSEVKDAEIFYFDPVKQFRPRACFDMDICCTGPLVQDMRKRFFELWNVAGDANQRAYFPLQETPLAAVEEIDRDPRRVDSVPLRVISSGPHLRYGQCTDHYLYTMRKAEKCLDIMHMYLHPHKSIQRELETTLERGLSLRIVTSGNSRNSFSPVPRAFGFFNRSYFAPLSRAQIYEFAQDNVLYHKKVLIVDQRFSLIGSYNLGKKSHYGDYELVVDIDSPKVAKQFLDVMEADINYSDLCCESQATCWYESLWYQIVNGFQRLFILGPVL